MNLYCSEDTQLILVSHRLTNQSNQQQNGPQTPNNEPVQSISNINITVKNRDSSMPKEEAYLKKATFSEMNDYRQQEKINRKQEKSRRSSLNRMSKASILNEKQSEQSSKYDSYNHNQNYLNASYGFNQSLSNDYPSIQSNFKSNNKVNMRTPGFEQQSIDDSNKVHMSPTQKNENVTTSQVFQTKDLVGMSYFAQGDGGSSSVMGSPMISQRYQHQITKDSQILNNQPASEINMYSQSYNLGRDGYIDQNPNLNDNGKQIWRIQDQNWLYEVNEEDLKLFRQIRKQINEDLKIHSNRLAGYTQQTMYGKSFNHLNQNLRPKSTSTLHRGIKEQQRQRTNEQRMLSEFYLQMRTQGKGKYIGSKDPQRAIREEMAQREGQMIREEPANHEIASGSDVKSHLNSSHVIKKQSSHNSKTMIVYKKLSRQYQDQQSQNRTQYLQSSSARLIDQNDPPNTQQDPSTAKASQQAMGRRFSNNQQPGLNGSSPKPGNLISNQENLDISNLMYINSFHNAKAIGMGAVDQRPFSATPLAGINGYVIALRRDVKSGGYPGGGQDPSLLASTNYNMKPLMMSQGTVKRDASIQNDRTENSIEQARQPWLGQIQAQIRFENIANLRALNQFHQNNVNLNHQVMNNGLRSPSPVGKLKKQNSAEQKPLWIVSTSKRQRDNLNPVLNHKGNLILDQLKQLERQKSSSQSPGEKAISPQNHENLNKRSENQLNSKPCVSNPIRVQNYDIELQQTSELSQREPYKPKFSNSQIKKLMLHKKNNQSATDYMSQGSSPQNQHYRSISLSQGNHKSDGVIYDTPMFLRDQMDMNLIDKDLIIDYQKGEVAISLDANTQDPAISSFIIDASKHKIVFKDESSTLMGGNGLVIKTLQKKNILISKKSPIPGFVHTSALNSGDCQTPQQEELKLPSKQMSQISGTNQQHSSDDKTSSAGTVSQLTQDQPANTTEIIRLEHIQEETAESFDSDQANSCHTMPSNFIHDNNTQFPYNAMILSQQSPLTKKKASRSFNENNPLYRVMSEGADENIVSGVQPSLTDRIQNSLETGEMGFTLGQYNYRNLSPQKSKSINNSGYMDQSRVVIYRDKEKIVRNTQSQNKTRRYQGAPIDLTKMETRNVQVINAKSSSKTPTTRVISKIGGNQVNSASFRATGQENIERSLKGENQIMSNRDSISSLNENQTPLVDLHGETEGFLGIPRYEVKESIKAQTHVEVNGVQILHDSNMNLNEEAFMEQIPKRLDSSFDIRVNSSPFSGAIGPTLEFQRNIEDFQKNQQRMTQDIGQSQKNRDLMIMSQERHQKRKTVAKESFGMNMVNLMDIDIYDRCKSVTPVGFVSENQGEIPFNQSSQDYVEKSHNQYLQHQKDYRISQEKKHSQMLRRNISILRRQKVKQRFRNKSLDQQGIAELDPGYQNSNLINITSANMYSSAMSFQQIRSQQAARSSVRKRANQLDAQISPINYQKVQSAHQVKFEEIPKMSQNDLKMSGLLLKEYFNNQGIESSSQILENSQSKQIQNFLNIKNDSTNVSKFYDQSQSQNRVSSNELLAKTPELNEIQQQIIKKIQSHNTSLNQHAPYIITDQQALLNHEVWLNKNKSGHEQSLLKRDQQRRLVNSGQSTQGPLSANSSQIKTSSHNRRTVASMFRQNNLIIVQNGNQTPIVGNMAIHRNQAKSSSSRYKVGKNSHSQISHTTQPQTRRIGFELSNSGQSNSSFLLNGIHMKGFSRPMSKVSNREILSQSQTHIFQ